MSNKKLEENIKSVGTLSSIASLNVIASFVNIIIIVYYFGVSRELEIYFAALTLFQLAQKLSHSGFIGEVFIPYLVKFHNTYIFQSFVNSIINILILFCVALIVILYFSARPLMNLLIPGFSPDDISKALQIYVIVLPLLSLTILNSFFDAILQSRKRFGVAEMGIFIGQVCGVVILMLFVAKYKIYALLISFIIIPISRFIYASINIKDIYKNYRLELNWKDENISSSIKKITPFIGYTLVTQGVQLFMISIVSFLPQGSLAVLKYSQQIFNKISSITTGPIVTVSFVEFTEALRQSVSSYIKSFKKTFIYSLMLNIFLLVLFIISGKELLSLLFVRGSFSSNDANLLYYCLMVQIIGWPFIMYWVMAKKSLLAIHKTSLVNGILISYQIIFVTFVYLYSKVLGVIGVLLATSFTSFIFVFVYYQFQKKYLSFRFSNLDYSKMISILMIFCIGIVPVFLFKYLTQDALQTLFMNFYLFNAANIIIVLAIYFPTTFLMYKIFYVEEIHVFLSVLGNILRKMVGKIFTFSSA